MNYKLKSLVIFLGLGTFIVGLVTSLSSFGTVSTSENANSSSVDFCYDTKYLQDCPANTNYTLTANGSVTTSYSITTGSSTVTISGLGFSLSFPKRSGTNSTTETGSNNVVYTLVQNVTNSSESYCYQRTSPGGQACARVDCYGHTLQTYNCANPGTGTGTSRTSFKFTAR